MIPFILGVASGVTGAVLLYLASPNQRVTRRRTARKDLALAGVGAEAVSLAAFLAAASPATAVFIWMTLAMLAWSVAPLLTVWRDAKGARR